MGLDQYEVGKWEDWHRHITLAMPADAYLSVTRHRAAESGAFREKGAVRAETGS